ncbi:MAG: LytR C-terminal domain-containing protein [Chitinispirillales bacterium]|jgi:hypothetical protein|nr:LytR C-terminal domain-containing protein [Chitinispirillales bacterium]
MRNLILFATILIIIGSSLFIGVSRRNSAEPPPAAARQGQTSAPETSDGEQAEPAPQIPSLPLAGINRGIPHIGSIQVLNGCGVTGAADRVADFLRARNFDVKDIGNASSWNYPGTMIISRTVDMALANELEKLLKTGKVTLIRNRDEHLYDVTVVVGPGFEDKIR